MANLPTSAQMSNNQGSLKRRERFWELDFIRGICVLLMVFDHVMQLMYLSDSDRLWDLQDAYMSSAIQNFFHPVIRAVFFLVCGISCVLSRSNFKRGTQLMGLASFITLATLLLSSTSEFFYGITIIFGVLHMLAVSILFFAVLDKLSASIPKVGKLIPPAIGLFCIVFFYAYINGKTGDYSLGYFPAIAGFEVNNYIPADHSPLFPEMGFVLIGGGLGQFYKSRFKNVLKPLDGKWNKPVCFVGRKALLIYILQPIVVGAIYMLI